MPVPNDERHTCLPPAFCGYLRHCIKRCRESEDVHVPADVRLLYPPEKRRL